MENVFFRFILHFPYCFKQLIVTLKKMVAGNGMVKRRFNNLLFALKITKSPVLSCIFQESNDYESRFLVLQLNHVENDYSGSYYTSHILENN